MTASPDYIAPMDNFADLRSYGLTVDGHPVVAMTHGIAASLHRTYPCNRRPVRGTCEMCVGRLSVLLTMATDAAGPGEPIGNLYKLEVKVTSPSGVADETIWIKQNHPYDEYIVLCPCEY